jgi:hypothetical protein
MGHGYRNLVHSRYVFKSACTEFVPLCSNLPVDLMFAAVKIDNVRAKVKFRAQSQGRKILEMSVLP